jgi:hypothetical protein
LKQLQLIQILSINARGCAAHRISRANAAALTAVLQALRSGKGGIRTADTAF